VHLDGLRDVSDGHGEIQRDLISNAKRQPGTAQDGEPVLADGDLVVAGRNRDEAVDAVCRTGGGRRDLGI
jgi:hypothetical protein